MAYNQTTGITSDSPDGGAFDERSSSSITSTNQAKDILDAAALQAALSAESATDSAASATAAGISESNASISEVNSASDVISAANSATESAESAADALLSENAASNSETNSTNSATAASISEGNSANSAISAATSATASANSATNSSNSATTSATNATNSANSATTSASSATNAASSASSAQTAQTAAETAETNAAILASNAASSASNAASSVSTATTQATNAASSASSAATSATDSASSASTSASNASGASTSATNAGTSETNAATSASASANSASNAASSAASAASALDSFDDRYLGAKSSAPTLDNDGDALVTGALYYDTTETGMFVYDGSQWLVASSATQAILTVYNYTATSGQTTFSGVDDNTATLTYVSGSIIVTLNGIFLEDNADYTATSGTSVTLTTGANSNDELNVYAYNTFDSVNVYALGDTRYFQLSSTNEDISVNSITATGGTINGTSVGASTPSTGAFTSLSTSGVNNLAGLTASTALALDVSKNVVSVANTGTGSNVLNTSPTLVTPALGTPASGIMTNVTGTATALNIGGNAATATNASTVTTNADLTGAVTSVGNAASLGSFTSAQLATALTDETGTGANVFATSPTLVTPALGTPSSGVVTNLTGTASININGTVGASTPSTGAFTTLSATGTSTLAAVHTTGVMTMGSAAYWKAEVSTGFRFNNAADTVNLLIIPDNAPVTIAKGLAVTGAISSTTGANFATSSGNVGIGTSSPIGKLAVVGGAIQLSGGTSAQAGLRMQTVSGVADLSGINNDNNTFNPISISTNGTERLRVDSAGNVGIGTSSPFAKMNPAGATSTSSTAYSSSAPPTAGQLDVRSTDAYTTQLGGKITFSGISGTGEVALSVYGAIQGYKENAFASNAGGGLILSTTDNASGTLNERARIDPSGNLLVGTTAGNAKLSIHQSTQGSVQSLAGPGGNQGPPNFITVVKQLPAVSAGTQIIIPFAYQTSINNNTIVRIRGVSAQYNTNNPKPFVCEFAVGHLVTLYNLTSWNLQGVTSVTKSGMNVVITLSAAAYTGATSNGVFITLEYLSSFVSFSIDVENIAMN